MNESHTAQINNFKTSYLRPVSAEYVSFVQSYLKPSNCNFLRPMQLCHLLRLPCQFLILRVFQMEGFPVALSRHSLARDYTDRQWWKRLVSTCNFIRNVIHHC